MTDNQQHRYWFPAKKYGWGWGSPHTWQGLVVLIAFVALLYGGTVIIPGSEYPKGSLVYCLSLSGILIAICFAKGEPPSWRWGK